MAYMNAYNTKVFSEFTNNSYGFLNNKQKAAILVFKRKNRFVGGYDIHQELRELITKFFGNSLELQKNGLKMYYNELKNYVEENDLIGLIIFGADTNNMENKNQYVSTYVNIKNKIIKLEISTICQVLLKEYFDNDNNYIDKLCEKTPGFDIYYKST